jgi:hypothetical protein
LEDRMRGASQSTVFTALMFVSESPIFFLDAMLRICMNFDHVDISFCFNCRLLPSSEHEVEAILWLKRL